ncbi:hypothetical protein OIU79_018803 [Salix purpurea]|uniref:Uncharacterized protein n=1 Tax=Salix purpurea TaxID=77065 RepID=A0A9Q0NZP2_SALPP|nr:hypothetical protein OIU79_018803 [Salix purpurea]
MRTHLVYKLELPSKDKENGPQESLNIEREDSFNSNKESRLTFFGGLLPSHLAYVSVWLPLAWPGLELLHLGLTSPLLPSFFPGWFKPLFPRFSSNSRSNAPGTELFSCCRMASFWPSGAQASYSFGTGFLGLPCGVSSPAFPGLLGELTWFCFSGW